jgi:hypothetical protein
MAQPLLNKLSLTFLAAFEWCIGNPEALRMRIEPLAGPKLLAECEIIAILEGFDLLSASFEVCHVQRPPLQVDLSKCLLLLLPSHPTRAPIRFPGE